MKINLLTGIRSSSPKMKKTDLHTVYVLMPNRTIRDKDGTLLGKKGSVFDIQESRKRAMSSAKWLAKYFEIPQGSFKIVKAHWIPEMQLRQGK